MNNIFMRKITVTADYQPLVAERTVLTAEISCPPGNVGTVYFRGDDGSDVPWISGEWHLFARVNLAEIFVKGTPGDMVSAIGGSW
jgi:hypothetical protein